MMQSLKYYNRWNNDETKSFTLPIEEDILNNLEIILNIHFLISFLMLEYPLLCYIPSVKYVHEIAFEQTVQYVWWRYV